MARSFPADTKLQHFFTEQFEHENNARLQWYFQNKRGGDSSGSSGGARQMKSGLTTMNPMVFSRNMRTEERKMLADIAKEAEKTKTMEEMRPIMPAVKEKLYEGFSNEGKGRYDYLKDRHDSIPEKKYPYKYLSSWEYGWHIGEQFQLKRPQYARSKKIQDSFYTSNGVPTLGEPSLRVGAVERCYTTIM